MVSAPNFECRLLKGFRLPALILQNLPGNLPDGREHAVFDGVLHEEAYRGAPKYIFPFLPFSGSGQGILIDYLDLR